MINGALLTKDEPILHYIFSGSRIRQFCILSIPGWVLVIFAYAIGIDSIPYTSQKGKLLNAGYIYAWNWSLLNIIIWPGVFTSLSWLSNYIENAVKSLSEIGVIKKKQPGTGNIVSDLSEHISSFSRKSILIILFLVFTISYIDTMDIGSGYYYENKQMKNSIGTQVNNGSVVNKYSFNEEDWTVAFQWDNWQKRNVVKEIIGQAPSLMLNQVFIILAYSVQGFVIFLGFYWVSKILYFFVFLSRLLSSRHPNFSIELIIREPLRRFGLAPLGNIFNTFLSTILCFELYVLYHRFQQVELVKNISIPQYLLEVLTKFKSIQAWFDPNFYHFDTIDCGTWFLLVGISLPVLTISWFPLFKLRKFIMDQKLTLSKQYIMERNKARETEDDKLAEKYDNDLKIIEESNIWPNGDKAGQRFLCVMLTCWMTALMPPLIPVLIVSVFLPEVYAILQKAIGK